MLICTMASMLLNFLIYDEYQDVDDRLKFNIYVDGDVFSQIKASMIQSVSMLLTIIKKKQQILISTHMQN